MRIQTEEWEEFAQQGPGMRMYKDKMTLFYNGEQLVFNTNIYNREERRTWEVIIVLPGVEVIPGLTFSYCENVKTIIMSDTVRRIEYSAFKWCRSLEYIKLSRNLEYIGRLAFETCCYLTSLFIPPSCREICRDAFKYCRSLIILSVPRDTQLGENVIHDTALIRKSHFETNQDGKYENHEEVNNWIREVHMDDQYALHRVCASFNPLPEVILQVLRSHGLKALKMRNSIGITPFQYLESNPFADIDQKEIMKQYILEMMGEVV